MFLLKFRLGSRSGGAGGGAVHRRGYKDDPMIVEDDAAGTKIVKAEGAPKTKTLLNQEGKPAKTTPKSMPKGKP